MVKIYNTLTGKKEGLVKPENRPLRLFVCGPTVYDHAHIGHARTYLSFDIIVRYLRKRGFKIFYLQNITNIDDKIIDRAKKDKTSPQKLARLYEKEYYKDIKALGIKTVDKYARASDFIPEIIKQIKTLIKKGYAYKTKNGVYFEVRKFKDYGKLSRQNLDKLRPGWRLEPDPEKKDPLDFALWKLQKRDYEPAWDSPWGKGRPGWHIEDTAISEKFFGPQYDLHGGAEDLKFPHHEAEIAQQESASGKRPFVKIWMHPGLLYVNNEKMSKSLKNFITIKDFLKKHPPEVLRWIVLTHHYRSKINYNEETALKAEESLKTIKEFFGKLDLVKSRGKMGGAKQIVLKGFDEKMEDDFNTPEALAVIFKFIGENQNKVWNMKRGEAKSTLKLLQNTFKVLGIKIKPEKIPAKVRRMAKKREKLRENKQFVQTDALRNRIRELGYEIEDTPLGPLVLKK